MKKENVIDDVNNDEIDILFEEQEDNNDQVEEDDKKHLIKNPILRELLASHLIEQVILLDKYNRDNISIVRI